MAQSTTAIAGCVGFPEQTEPPLATYCENENTYSFDLGGDHLTFAKQEFQTRLTQSISQWWLNHGLPIAALNHVNVDVWLSIPEVNPQAAQARAVVFTPLGNANLSFDLHEQNWKLSDQEGAILDRAVYPQSYGWRPQQVLLSFVADTPHDAIASLLKKSGIALGEEMSPGWFRAETAVFDESAAIRRLTLFDQSGYIRSAQLNKLVEWIAIRGRTVHFNMATVTP